MPKPPGTLKKLRRPVKIFFLLGRRGLPCWLAHRRDAAAGAERLRRLFEQLGGSFLKLGQLLAVHPEIVPPVYCRALLGLLDRVPPFSVEEVDRIITEELGRAPAAVFERFERTPLAAASIAQVHEAELGGQRVAVKVQRPSAAADFSSDLLVLGWIRSTILTLRRRSLFWLARAIGELAAWTSDELDFRCEARYLTEAGRRFRDDATVAIPEVFAELSGRRVLVAELLEGPTLLDLFRDDGGALRRQLDRQGFQPSRFAGRIIKSFLESVFEHGVFHADPHPANVLILPGDVVGYVDFGISGTLSAFTRYHLLRMNLALNRADAAEAVRALMPVLAEGCSPDPEAYRRQLERCMEDWFRGSGKERRLAVRYTRVMTDLLHLTRRYDLIPEPRVLRYMRSIIATEELVHRLAPDLDVARDVERECARLLREAQLQRAFSPAALAGLALSLTRRLRRGVDRFLSPPDADPEPPPSADDRGERGASLQLPALALAAALLAALQPSGAPLGVNLLTLELSTAVLAAVLYLVPWRPWRSSEPPEGPVEAGGGAR